MYTRTRSRGIIREQGGGNDQERARVSTEEVAGKALLSRVEDLDEEDVDLVGGHQRPREDAEEGELERDPHDEAEGAAGGLAEAEDHEELHEEEVGAEVGVDPDAVGHLGGAVGDKEDDAGQEAAGGEAAAREGHRPQGPPLARVKVGRDVEDESEVGEVIASANCIAFTIVVGRAKRNYRAGLK